ncbi:hypothetical protein BABINDRAFT_162906 [Babjeviella inositovora NRRL Y-12698]|uniref:Cyclic nucleotide-binding domain-containing protein n=1 Tax=Babjeviella inositovora NRRL Y-12698 TaxID=984486 RepID=A0A1E3QKV4_9ASCO|nr:uncharacterized protein BABINDRAFT_162906 [Babjeviella inositovora NRRL Y-12698]ODQ78248.1 hypothetical protein BABINDRAFT_162906 [Babjeviella inositovora NRRL Y-12698]
MPTQKTYTARLPFTPAKLSPLSAPQLLKSKRDSILAVSSDEPRRSSRSKRTSVGELETPSEEPEDIPPPNPLNRRSIDSIITDEEALIHQEVRDHVRRRRTLAAQDASDAVSERISDDAHSTDAHEDDFSDDDVRDESVPDMLLNKLRTLPLFMAAPNSFLVAVASRLKLIQLNAQEYVVKAGEPSKSMYWILKGTVGVTSPDGEAVHAELAAGSFFGEIGILFNRPRTATVVSRTRVLLGVLTADALNLVLPSYPVVERRIRDEAQERLAMQEKKKNRDLPMILPFYAKRNSVIWDTPHFASPKLDPNAVYASNVATAAAQLPGPSLPPISHFVGPPVPSPTLRLTQSELPEYPPAGSDTSQPDRTSHSYLYPSVDSSISTRGFLQKLAIFQTLPPSIIHRLALDAEPLCFDAFEYVFCKGDHGSDIYFVVSGDVEVIDREGVRESDSKDAYDTTGHSDRHDSANDTDGRDNYRAKNIVDKVLARMGPGNYFGEMAFLNSLATGSEVDSVRTAYIRTITTVDLIVVRSAKLITLCKQYPLIFEDMRLTALERTEKNGSTGSHQASISLATLNLPPSPASEIPETGPGARAEARPEASPNKNTVTSIVSPAPQAAPFGAWSFNNQSASRMGSQLTVSHPARDLERPTSISPLYLESPPCSRTHSLHGLTKVEEDQLLAQGDTQINALENALVNTPAIALANVQTNILAQPQPLATAQASAIALANASPFSGFTFNEAIFNSKKRKADSPSPTDTAHGSIPRGTSPLGGPDDASLSLTIPPMNPLAPLVNIFANHLNSSSSQFQYMSHAKRVRLASISGQSMGRRKSSVLSTGLFPDRILLKVLGYMALPDLMKMRKICRRWRQLLHVAPNLFEVLDLTPWNTSLDDKALIAITDFVGTRPKAIDISNCFHITDEGFSYMVNEIGIGGTLRTIKMRSTWEISAMAIMDLAVPSIGRYLVAIDLSNCRKVRDDVIERLLGWNGPQNQQRMLQNLREDHGLMGAPLPEMALFDSLDETRGLIGCRSLKELNLGYCKHLTDRTIYHMAMYANNQIESLDLTRCTTITDAGFAYWAYQPFPNLRLLNLADCTFLSDKSIISIASSAKNLQTLDLSFCCSLSDVAIEVLCLGCPQLCELLLSFCGSAVSDPSLVAISLHLRHLARLCVKGCVRVTRAGVDALLSGVCPLEYLDISQCRNAHIYPGGILAETLPLKPGTRSVFVSAGPARKVTEIVI